MRLALDKHDANWLRTRRPLTAGAQPGHPFFGNQLYKRGATELAFDESQHPRDDHGRFSDSGNSGDLDFRGRDGYRPRGVNGNRKLKDALRETPGNPDIMLNPMWHMISETDLGNAKEEIVDNLTRGIMERVDGETAREFTSGTPLQNEIDAMMPTWIRDTDATGELTREEVVRELVQDYVDSWANTASGTDPTALALQRAVAAEFAGARSAAFESYLQDAYDESKTVTGQRALELQVAQTEAREGNLMRAFAREEYEQTQAWLEEHDIEEVTLYRGLKFSEELATGQVIGVVPEGFPEHGEAIVNVDLNPASSWSVDRDVAFGFSQGPAQGYLLRTTVPAGRILSTSRTGAGALREAEVRILNGPTTVDVEAVEWDV